MAGNNLLGLIENIQAWDKLEKKKFIVAGIGK
jgi:hypothetical protein